MEQEHRISYKAGITRTPSDFLCSDGELAECINLTTDNEELKPIVQPAEFVNDWATGLSGKAVIVYVHKVANRDNYIAYFPENNNKLCFGNVNNKIFIVDVTFENFVWHPNDSKITSIGKTLIISDSEGIHYFVYKQQSYYQYDDIPAPDVEFKLTNNGQRMVFDVNGVWAGTKGNTRQYGVLPGKQAEFNDIIVGAYTTLVNMASRKKAFSRPFLVRYALEMYDGTYYHISQPIAMFPAVGSNCWIQMIDSDGIFPSDEEFKMYLHACLLTCKSNRDLSDFSDLIKNISIFVSREIEINDTISDQHLDNFTNGIKFDTISAEYVDDPSTYKCEKYVAEDFQHPEYTPWRAVIVRSTHDVMTDIASASVFYKLSEIGLSETTTFDTLDFDEHKIENITTQDRLENDDFYSRCRLFPLFQYSYNSRLNIANVSRGFFEGFDFFMPYDNDAPNTYTAYVKIVTDSDVYWMEHQYTTSQKQGIYFYYPDSRAKHVTIFKGDDCVCDTDLTEHSGLNGSYYLNKEPLHTGRVWTFVDEEIVSSTTPDFHPNNHQNDNNKTELLPNYIITSEVNNPWVFLAKGYNKVGTGKIVGIAEITMALSQDAYGRSDLIVFSESGIWGMSVDSSGLFQSIHPYTRDVCINSKSITKVDFGVFFVSKHGLMLATDAGVKCVSTQMNGVTFNTVSLSPLATGTEWAGIVSACQGSNSFLDYIRDSRCFIAYDYIDSRLLIINSAYGYQYIFNMKDGTISKTILPQIMTSCVASYPDNLLQSNSKVYSFYEKPREEEVSGRQTAFLLTRPMKLAGPVSQASLRQLMNVGDWNEAGGSVVKTDIYLSSDMRTWYNDISRFGAAARYYRLALYIKMLPTERLSGTLLTSQERRNNNIR